MRLYSLAKLWAYLGNNSALGNNSLLKGHIHPAGHKFPNLCTSAKPSCSPHPTRCTSESLPKPVPFGFPSTNTTSIPFHAKHSP